MLTAHLTSLTIGVSLRRGGCIVCLWVLLSTWRSVRRSRGCSCVRTSGKRYWNKARVEGSPSVAQFVCQSGRFAELACEDGGGDENAPQVAPLDVHACAAAFSQSVLLVAESAQLRAPLGVALWFLPTCTPAWSHGPCDQRSTISLHALVLCV